MRRPPPELARRLLAASPEVLRPDRELRLEDVAALVGSARATLYYYFSGRDDLISFLLEEHLGAAAETIGATIGACQPPAARLSSAVAALVAYLGERPGVLAGLLSFAGDPVRASVMHALKDTLLVTPLVAILEEGSASGAFALEDPRDAAHAIIGAAMIATLARWHDGRDTTSARFRRAIVTQLVRGVACVAPGPGSAPLIPSEIA